jgi:hypothetical protein
MTLSETQRIGQTMQDLVWKPAKQVHTKSIAGLVAKLIIVPIVALFVLAVTGAFIFLTSKRIGWQVKLIVSMVVIVLVML